MTAHRQAIKQALADQTMNGEYPQLKLLMPLIPGSHCVDADTREVAQIELSTSRKWL